MSKNVGKSSLLRSLSRFSVESEYYYIHCINVSQCMRDGHISMTEYYHTKDGAILCPLK